MNNQQIAANEATNREGEMSADHEANWSQLCEFVERVMANEGIPGAAVGILHGDRTEVAGFGVTNVDHPLPVTDETLFQIGSITKTFTGTAVMRLVEKGVLDLDAPVRTYLPDFRVSDEGAAANATVRHLLTHMGGWVGDHFEDTGAGDDALDSYVAGMADLVQLAPLGAVWSYNNAGFSVAGRIIEVVTGESFEAAMQELVLDPLAMENSYLAAEDVMTHGFVVGHRAGQGAGVEGAQVLRPWQLPRAVRPAGGIICDVQDLLRYARFHLGDGSAEDGSRFLARTSMVDMQSPHATLWGSNAWGLTWAIEEIDGVRQVRHGGGTVGQISLLALAPDRNFAIAVLTNADRGAVLTNAVRRRALNVFLGVNDPQPTPLGASVDELAPYAGVYERPFAEIELGMLGGKLVGQMTIKGRFPSKDAPPPPSPPPMTFDLCAQDRLLVLDGSLKDSTVDVVRDVDGAIGWLRISNRLHRRMKR